MRISRVRLFAVSTVWVLMCYAVAAQAACKGVAEGDCAGDMSCIWVGGYERKDGIKVDGYCRNKSGKASVENGRRQKGAKVMDSGDDKS